MSQNRNFTLNSVFFPQYTIHLALAPYGSQIKPYEKKQILKLSCSRRALVSVNVRLMQIRAGRGDGASGNSGALQAHNLNRRHTAKLYPLYRIISILLIIGTGLSNYGDE